MKVNQKIGIIGCGKRFTNVYSHILEKLNYEVYVWNRTSKKSLELCQKNEQLNYVENLAQFKQLNLNLILCFVPANANFDLINKNFNGSDFTEDCPLLIETPVADPRWIQFSQNSYIGVLEQWVSLPLEQFKKKVYDSKLIDKPYWVFNDGRSFDYHAIAQLRSYINHSIPNTIMGYLDDIMNPGFIDKEGQFNNTSDFWTHGYVRMSDNSILMHSFAYNCKASLLKHIQLLRATSVNGSIVTGRVDQMDNDYEMAEIRYLNNTREVICEKISATRERQITLELNAAGLVWKNPYASLGFDDQQTAMATVIDNALNKTIYTAKDGFIDNMTIDAMKNAAYNNTILKLTQ